MLLCKLNVFVYYIITFYLSLQKKLQQRFHALTGIRAIAATMVFLYHNRKHWRSSLPELITQNLNEYHTGVTLFFVLSGFLIAYTYTDKPLTSAKQYLQYLLVRLARVFPVFLLLLFIQHINAGFSPGQTPWLNYTLLKGFSDAHNLDGIPQSWSLTVELCFYIVAPFIYYSTKKHIAKALLYLLLLTGIAIATGYIWHAINGNPHRWLYNFKFIFDGTFFGRSIEFFAGVLLAYGMQTNSKLLAWVSFKNKTLIGGVLCMACIYAISLLQKDIYSHGTATVAGMMLRNLVLPFFIVIFLYGLIVENTWLQQLLSSKFFALLGNASFIFYLIHIGYLNQVLQSKFLLPDRNFVVLWLTAIAGYLLVEKPVYDFCRKLVKRL